MLIIIGFLAGAFLLSPICKNQKYKNLYLILIWASLVFITAFRSYSYYTDTVGYYHSYTFNANRDLSVLFSNVINGEGKDPFYHFCSALFSHAGLDFRVWLIAVSSVYYGGFVYVVKRFSNLPFISVFGLVALSYVFFTMTGIRQTIAMGFTFFAFVKAYDKKLIPFLLFIIAGWAFHSSALIFLLVYPLMHRRIGLLQVALLVVAMGMAVLFPGAINTIVRELAWNEDLANYANVTTGLSIFGYVIQLLLAGGSILIAHEYCFTSKEGVALINMAVLGLVFQSFVINIDNIFRLSMYFSVYGVVLVGNALSKLNDRNTYYVFYTIVCVAFVSYMIYNRAFANFTMFGGI
ncbi:MAG: EpsG family protein [Clostridia bacterium]|nr:EpsG family protein [Clostridia bacterium]